jgi:hypothetical protein
MVFLSVREITHTHGGSHFGCEAVVASGVGTEHIRQLVSITLLRNRYVGRSTTETNFFDEDCTTQRAKLIKWMRMRLTAHRVISTPRSNRVASGVRRISISVRQATG